MSTAHTIFPYARTEAVEMTVHGIQDVGTNAALTLSNGDDPGYGPKTIDIVDVGTEWSTIRVEVTIALDATILRGLLLASEDLADVIAAVVSLNCARTKFRAGYHLARTDSENEWKGTLEISRVDLHGVVELHPMLLRRIDAPGSDPDRATFAGAILGEGRDTRLIIDRAARVYRHDFLYSWVDFREADDQWLQERANDLVYAAPGTPPRIYLNLRWPSLQPVLEARDRESQPLRQAYAALIRHTVWTQLLMTSVCSIDKSEEEWHVPGDPWRADLVVAVADHLFPSLDEQEQLENLHAALRDPFTINKLMAQVTSLAHDYSDAGKLLNEAANALQRTTPNPT